MNNGSLRHFFFLSIIVLLVSIVAGCTSSNEPAKPTVIVSEISKVSPTASIIAESKTGQEKIVESIELAVADGTYVEDSTYDRPNGNETVTFSITVENDIVKAVSITTHNPAPISAKIIQGFSDALPELVIGKKINELNLPKNVGGSSLSNAAFQKYVAKLIETK
ncbi:hypothetical protein HY989_02490 [Candidatus Micrarchaeota archaeon]|nr:hypothetical protein [Candidatus Micrarchaeota archaeon]